MRTFTALIALCLSFGAPAQDPAKAKAGEQVYRNYCETCHGDGLVSTGQTFDLRKLKSAERARFETAILNGKNQMPPWKGVVSPDEIEQLWNYVRTKSTEP